MDEEVELTPEEQAAAKKLAKKQLKAAKRAEKKRLREEKALALQKQLKRDEFGREHGLSNLIYQNHEEEWEKIMFDVSQENLRSEVEGLWANVRHVVDRKRNLLERLNDERETAREQVRRSATMHLEFLDHSKKLFKSFAASLKDMYESEIEAELSEFRDHYVWKKQVTTKRKYFFENLMLGSNSVFDHQLEQFSIQFEREKGDFIDSDIANREAIRDSIQSGMQRLYGQMKKTVEEIRRTSMAPDRLKTYMKLVEREREDALSFAKMKKQSQISAAKIEALSEQRRLLELSTMKNMSEMKKEKEYFMECYAILRDRYDSDMKQDQQRMRNLMDKTYTTIMYLKELEKRCGLLLGVSSVIRKFQTEKEKVLPWPDNFTVSSNEETMTVADQMEPMWIQMSEVNAQNLALEEEKGALQKENERLRDLIRRYCSQEKYAQCIRTLNISTKPTVVVPAQEAAHMVQLNKFSPAK